MNRKRHSPFTRRQSSNGGKRVQMQRKAAANFAKWEALKAEHGEMLNSTFDGFMNPAAGDYREIVKLACGKRYIKLNATDYPVEFADGFIFEPKGVQWV